MFKSALRPIVIPQSEHLHLTGALANLWGNAQFELPPLPRASVIMGIAFHDRAYGYVDNNPIGEMEEATALAITRRGFYMPCADPVADLITRHHLLRLTLGRPTPAGRALVQEMQPAIQAQIAQNNFSADLFARVDRMTKFCDDVSFDFCREAPAERTVPVFARYEATEPTPIQFRIAEGIITLDPWPLSVAEYSGYIVGYQIEGYPERLEGVLVPYTIRPGK